MDSNKKLARLSGSFCLLAAIGFMFSLGYVPGRFLVEGNATATVNAIADAELVFRFGIVVGMITCALYALQVLALYKLLSPVDRNAASIFVAFSLAHLPLFFSGHIDELNLLSLLNENRYGGVFDRERLHAQVLLLVDSYHSSVRINQVFMGLWLLPFGYLVFKAGFLPRWLGIVLLLNALPYLISFFRQLLAPGYEWPASIRHVLMFFSFGEFIAILWLLIMGAKARGEPGTSAAV